MADLPDPTSNGGASTLESDDISSLLNALLQNSSQISSSAHLTPLQNQPHEIRRQFQVSFPFDSSSCMNLPFFSSGLNDRVENAFSTSIPFTMEGIGDADCESEEQEEGLVHRVPARSSSKRSRAAEVHNLSEKRRRQRINEKMKALQKLIPNSNKTDKASMLDEAIEYLKQLQLQVQMLTMRNGSSLHPFYMTGLAQSTRLPPAVPLFDEGNSSRVGSFPANQEASMQAMFDLSTKNAPSDYKSLLTRMSENNNSRTTFVQEASTNAHNRPFNATMLSKLKVLCKDSSLPQSLLETSHCGQSSSSGVSS